MQHDPTERRPYNAASDFVDANVARGLGRKIAFVDPDRSLTYGDLQTRSIRLANALRSLGVEHARFVGRTAPDRSGGIGFGSDATAGSGRRYSFRIRQGPE